MTRSYDNPQFKQEKSSAGKRKRQPVTHAGITAVQQIRGANSGKVGQTVQKDCGARSKAAGVFRGLTELFSFCFSLILIVVYCFSSLLVKQQINFLSLIDYQHPLLKSYLLCGIQSCFLTREKLSSVRIVSSSPALTFLTKNISLSLLHVETTLFQQEQEKIQGLISNFLCLLTRCIQLCYRPILIVIMSRYISFFYLFFLHYI